MLVDDHASVRSAGARSAPEGVACHRSLYVAETWAPELTLMPNGGHCVPRLPMRWPVCSTAHGDWLLGMVIRLRGTPNADLVCKRSW